VFLWCHVTNSKFRKWNCTFCMRLNKIRNSCTKKHDIIFLDTLLYFTLIIGFFVSPIIHQINIDSSIDWNIGLWGITITTNNITVIIAVLKLRNVCNHKYCTTLFGICIELKRCRFLRYKISILDSQFVDSAAIHLLWYHYYYYLWCSRA